MLLEPKTEVARIQANESYVIELLEALRDKALEYSGHDPSGRVLMHPGDVISAGVSRPEGCWLE